MSTWTVEHSGDQLTLDDTKTVGEHCAAIKHAATALDQGRIADVTIRPAGAVSWRIEGDGFTLVTIFTAAEALRIAAAGGWREVTR